MKIIADSTLPGLDSAFPMPFQVTRYNSESELLEKLDNHEVLLCRSTLKVNRKLLDGSQVKFVATASSGTDHIDHLFLNLKGIQIIDAKGCNAVSVADYVESCLAYLTQHQLILGKKTGIIGMGKVGSEVYSRFSDLGYDLILYDPLKALQDSQFESCPLTDLYQCDIICIHAELHETQPFPSFNLINDEFLKQLKPGCIIINAARGGIVNEESLLNTSKSLTYCTDVYLNEPKINPRIIDRALICTPHIAGHSLEAKYAAVAIVSDKLHQLAGLPIPKFAVPLFKYSIQQSKDLSWYEQILSLYNPINETRQLKESKDKEAGFLFLRKSHNIRHDFSVYYSHGFFS